MCLDHVFKTRAYHSHFSPVMECLQPVSRYLNDSGVAVMFVYHNNRGQSGKTLHIVKIKFKLRQLPVAGDFFTVYYLLQVFRTLLGVAFA